jgi:hypothetical protein
VPDAAVTDALIGAFLLVAGLGARVVHRLVRLTADPRQRSPIKGG